MDIQASKIELAKMILDIDEHSVVNKFIDFLNAESTLSEQQKKAIDLALEQVDRGETIPHEVVMENMRRRYPKYFKK